MIASLGVVVCLAGLLFDSLSLAEKFFGADEAEEHCRPCGPRGTALPAVAADLWVLYFNRFLSFSTSARRSKFSRSRFVASLSLRSIHSCSA